MDYKYYHDAITTTSSDYYYTWKHCPNCRAPKINKRFIHEKGCVYEGNESHLSIVFTILDNVRK